MKLLKTALLTATAAAALSGAAMAQSVNPGNPASLNATATAEILKPLKITQTTPMAFGTVSLADGSQLGTAKTTGTETNVTRPTGSTGQNGVFSLNGASNQTVNISASSGSCIGAGVSNFTVQTSGPTALIDSMMSGSFFVTGSLDFDNNASGTITCDYTVTAQY